MFNLSEKKALITGGSGGIGAEIAKVLAEAGAGVIITGTNEEKLKKVQAEIGDACKYVVSNLSKEEDLSSLISDYLPEADILVCNAGITRDNLLLRMSDEEWNDVININLTANFKLIKASVRPMMKKRWGRIINISSVVGTSGNPGQANYCASKAGIIGLTKSVAIEVASRNITANSISPGFIETNMTDKLTDAQKEAILTKVPCGKLGTARDIAAAALYLASDEAGYITGQNIHVNGGMYLV